MHCLDFVIKDATVKQDTLNVTLSVHKLYSNCPPSMDTRLMSSSPVVNGLVKNWLFKTAPDIDEPPFQLICMHCVTRPTTMISSLVSKVAVTRDTGDDTVISLRNCTRYRETKNSDNSSPKWLTKTILPCYFIAGSKNSHVASRFNKIKHPFSWCTLVYKVLSRGSLFRSVIISIISWARCRQAS